MNTLSMTPCCHKVPHKSTFSRLATVAKIVNSLLSSYCYDQRLIISAFCVNTLQPCQSTKALCSHLCFEHTAFLDENDKYHKVLQRLQIQMTTVPIEEEEDIWRTNLTIISICGGSNSTVEHKLKERDSEDETVLLSTHRPSTQRAING